MTKSRRFARWAWCCCMPLALAGTLPAAPPAATGSKPAVRQSFKADDVDLQASTVLVNGKPAAGLAGQAVLDVLGFGVKAVRPWIGGDTANTPATYQYLVVFKRPVEIGSMLLCGSGGRVAVLNDGVAWPAAPDKTDAWTEVAFPPHQSGGRMATFPASFKTRALLCTETRDTGRSQITLWRLFAPRLHNLTPTAVANAESEYTSFGDLRPPEPYPARSIVTGIGKWRNTGPTGPDGRVPRAPISDVAPSWFTLSWPQPQSICGFFAADNFAEYQIATYTGPAGMNAAVATDRDWKKVREFEEVRTPAGRLVFFPPVSSSGLRLKILKVNGASAAQAAIDGLQVFTDLGTKPVPEPPADTAPPAPVRIAVTLPEDGELSLVVNDAKGRRVRNLMARAELAKGVQQVDWDLKDDDGHSVGPGNYTWKAIFHPPLALEYQLTPYPNIVAVAPENPPWQAGASGSGGWLADHSAPIAVTAAGKSVYLSAPCAESGVALIECDLQGRKQWGHHNLAAWTGPHLLASDGTSVYAAAPPNQAIDWQEHLWRIDPATKDVATVFKRASSETRRRGVRGLEARDGKVYLSIRAADDWLGNAMGAADVDIAHCAPVYPPMRKSNDHNEPDPRTDFLRLLRLTGTPPGNNVLTWLTSTDFPRASNHVVVAFNKEVPIGTLVFPFPEDNLRFEVSVLKPDAPYPPNPWREQDWTAVWKGAPADRADDRWWSVLPLPEQTITRGLRLSFRKGIDDLDDALEDEGTGPDLDDLGGANDSGLAADNKADKKVDKKAVWTARLEGLKLLRRRFENLLPQATVRVNSGTVSPRGEWDAKRDQAVTTADPGIYVMEWKEPQPIRGLAIKEIDGKQTEIDVFEGDGPVEIEGSKGWRQVATYEQPTRNYYNPGHEHNSTARYVDGYVDFGKEVATRAVRLRVVEQWSTKDHYPSGVRSDRGGQTLDLRRCRIYGVAALKALGGEPAVDPRTTERVEIVDGRTGEVEREVHLPAAGPLAFSPSGDLHALSANRVVKVDLQDGRHRELVTDLLKPTALAVDRQGLLYVFDAAADRQNVRVYDAAGKFLRIIGTPGGFKAGAWDATRLGAVSDLDVDDQGQLWVVENSYTPKRVTVWSAADGMFKKELLGNTSYGGGGVLDPYDKTRLFHAPQKATLEFAIDWETGASRLAKFWPGPAQGGELPIRIDGQTYLVTRPMFGRQQAGVVYLYEKDRVRCVAAVGAANGFEPLSRPDIIAKLGGKPLMDFQFMWSDRDGDGLPQAAEVEFMPATIRDVAWFDRTLGVQAGKGRYEVKEFLADGVPVYGWKECEGMPQAAGVRLSDGGTFFLGAEAKGRHENAVHNADGSVRWAWPTEGIGVHALVRARPYTPAQVVAEFDVIGVEKAAGGDLGEFLVTNSNVGTWHIWTADGLLAGRLFRDQRASGRQGWTMREHERGLRLDDCTIGQEHFSGAFCKTADDRYYVVAGHNHASVVEVRGLDAFKRFDGHVDVTPEIVQATQAWELARSKQVAYETARVLDCRPRGDTTIRIDGRDDDWPGGGATIDLDPASANDDDAILFRMAVDKRMLYLCYAVHGHGPLKNSGNDWHTYFKTGGCVDLQIATDPKADPDRRSPVQGDLRLLMTMVAGKPQAVLYRAVVPGTPADEAWTTSTLVGRTSFDRVEQLTDVQMACADDANGYIFEAAIPLERIGLEPAAAERIKLDWGILECGEDGSEVLQRISWSNKATSILADVALEAALHPELWGHARFSGADASRAAPSLDAPGTNDEDLNDLLGE